MDDWYRMSYKDVVAHGGGGLMNRYENSLFTALKTIYPERKWYPFRFKSGPHRVFTQWAHVEEFIQFAMDKLQIKQHEDWYRASMEQMWRLGGGQLILQNGGLYEVRIKTLF